MKIWIYCEFTSISNIKNNKDTLAALGVWYGQWTKTFLNDILVLIFSSLLLWHYFNQIQQAEYRLVKQGTLKFQTEIKLLHSVFGEVQESLFILAYFLFFADILVYQSFVQFAILIVLLKYIYNFSLGQNKIMSGSILRAIQIFTYCSVVFAFIARVPTVFDRVESKNQRLMQLIGLESEVDGGSFLRWYARSHRVILAFAIVMAEVFFVSAKINQEKPMLIASTQENTQANIINSKSQPSKLPLREQSKKKQKKQIQFGALWKILKLPCLLWFCRIVFFFSAYNYHDWQSLVYLIWVLHSAFFTDRALFVRIIQKFYLPMMIIIYLWYFTVNIYGLVDYKQWYQKGHFPYMYRFGFYQFTYPELNLGGYLIGLISIALYTRLCSEDQFKKRNLVAKLEKYLPTVHAWVYLVIVNIQILVFVYAVIFSLILMDFYHVALLFYMVFAMFRYETYNKHIIWLVFYVAFFILGKYISSLVVNHQEYYQSPPLDITLGFASPRYQPDNTRKYFRYEPPEPSWILLIAVGLQYRRNQVIGLDQTVIEKNSERSEKLISIKNPRLYILYKCWNILENHLIVIITFLLYLILIFCVRRSFLNLVSLALILILLCMYLNKGLTMLLRYWNVISVYQAFVLLALLLVEFIIYSKTFSTLVYPKLTARWSHYTLYQRALWHYAGFYQFKNELWKELLPYVTMFFLSIIVQSKFKSKLQYEEKQLINELNFQNVRFQSVESEITSERDDSVPFIDILNLDQDQASQREQVYHAARQRYFDMQYKLSYLLWKFKWAWPFFTLLSQSFNIILITFIVYFSLYYSIAMIWFVFMLIFVLQTWKVQRAHRSFRKKQFEDFKRFDQTNIRRETISSVQARNSKIAVKLEESRIGSDLQNQLLRATTEEEINRTVLTDEEAIEQFNIYNSEIINVTLESRHFFWLAQFSLIIISIIFTYISIFLVNPSSPTNPATLIPTNANQKQVLFIYFFMGFYQDQTGSIENSNVNYFNHFWPFFILLLLLIIEKICQLWLQDKFRTTDQLIQQFTQIEKVYKNLQQGAETSNQPVRNEDKSIDNDQSRDTFNPMSNQHLNKESEILNELEPLLGVKRKIIMTVAIKLLIQEVAIMLVFFSLIYKQSILSFVLYIVLIYYTIQKFRSKNPSLLVRYTVVAVILVQYLMAMTNLSSYNSPQPFPIQLTNVTQSSGTFSQTVYPNSETFFGVPWYFNATRATIIVNGQSLPIIKTQLCNFFGIAVSARPLNGIWLDYLVVVLMYVYLHNFSLWILDKPIKVVNSLKTERLLQEYNSLQKVQVSVKQIQDQVQSEIFINKFVKGLTEALYTNFGLMMITAVILMSIAGKNIIQLGYFIFSMCLIFVQRDFYLRPQSRNTQIYILKYLLLPYLLVDILMQLLFQIPFQRSDNLKDWTKLIGFVEAWTYQPTSLYLGQDVQVTDTIAENMNVLMFRGVIYFFISVQLDVVTSVQFLNFYDKILFENASQAQKIGMGLAYRFNNFKNQQLKQQAENYQKLDEMLKHVKQLLKTRNQKLKLEYQGSKLDSKNQFDSIVQDQDKVVSSDSDEEQAEKMQETNFLIQLFDAQDFRIQFKIESKARFLKKLEKMNVMFRFYLYLRHNYVHDILFKHSSEHLDDLLEQFREGRTSIKSQLEIGLMIESKQELLEERLEKLSLQQINGEITDAQLDQFQEFRKQVIAGLQPKPWERYDPKTYKSWKSLAENYVILIYKMLGSHLQLISYFFMLLAVIMNGGLLYMVYPAVLFGLALCEEDRPGKIYWYFLIFYTQLLILIQYVAQLRFATDFGSQEPQFLQNLLAFIINNNIGIKQLSNSNYSQVFWLLFPLIGLLLSILVTIQSESLAGILGVSLYDYESFVDGLKREQNNTTKIFEKEDQAKESEALQELLSNKLEVQFDSNNNQRSYSEDDGLIRVKKVDTKNNLKRVMDSAAFAFFKNKAEEGLDLDTEIVKNQLQITTKQRKRSHSFDFTPQSRQQVKTDYQMIQKLWENDLFDRLFPVIKQQKPGQDMYVWIASTSILIILYMIFFTTRMKKEQTSISIQFTNNQISGQMIVSVMIMMLFMVFDRYFYSVQSSVNRKVVSKKLDLDLPITTVSETNFVPENKNFQDWLEPQYIPKSYSRVMKFYFLWIELILVHWYIFFRLPNEFRVCTYAKFCNPFNQNNYLIVFYIIFCIYFGLCASQIRFGIPELKKGGFLLDRYDVVSKLTYETWYYLPFLFELRTIIDWTFTTTALDVFQSIKLAKVQSDMYIAKCFNRPYMEKQFGDKISFTLKVISGFSLMLFVLVLIVGPMYIFSTINPISKANPVSSAGLRFYIQFYNSTSQSNISIPLFTTTQMTKNKTLTVSEFEAMQFGYSTSQSDSFTPNQTQAIQFSPISDTVWSITQPKKAILNNALQDIMQNPDSPLTALAILESKFVRDTAASVPAIYKYQLPLTNSSQYSIIYNLSMSIGCNPDYIITFPNNIDVAISLNQKSTVTPLNQNKYPVYSGFQMNYYCNSSSSTGNYWMLQQVFPIANNTLYSAETQIFLPQYGFGYFTFNQKVLPNFISAYSSSVIVFYVAIVYVIAVGFRYGIVPYTYQIFIINAPFTEDILMICQCVFIYRVQGNLQNEEELFMILLDIMRSPETIKSLTGSSLKKTLDEDNE